MNFGNKKPSLRESQLDASVRAQLSNPRVAQPKTVQNMLPKKPVAPVVYRPQPLPRVLQAKTSRGARIINQSPYAPPVKSQPEALPGPKVPVYLQRRTAQLAVKSRTSVGAVQLAEQQVPEQQPPSVGAKRKIGGMSPEEAEKHRAAKFSKENKEAAVEKQKEMALIQQLKNDVDDFREKFDNRQVNFVCGPKGKKHGYQDPVQTFIDEFDRANFSDLEAAHTPFGLTITVRMGGKKTVTGTYRNGVLTVIHCGEVQNGVGYGKFLG